MPVSKLSDPLEPQSPHRYSEVGDHTSLGGHGAHVKLNMSWQKMSSEMKSNEWTS